MSIPIRIVSKSCHQPPRNTRRADAATLAIASNSCYQSPKPFSSLKGMGVRGRRCDRLGLALIDWPVVGVAAAFAMLFVVGLTMTAWLLEVRPAFGPPAAAPISESSTGLERISEEQEEVLTTLPASSRSFEPSSDHPAPFPKREGGEKVRSEGSLDGRSVLLPVPPNPPAPHPKREDGKGIRSAPANCRQTFGTSVEFVSRPALAARQARDDQKLLYVLHLSGNFENDRFT
jgi:hypothetical protein